MATKFRKTSNGGIPVVATVQAPRSTGVFTLTVDTQQYWPSGSTIAFSTYKVDTNNAKISGSQTDWEGTSNGTNTLSSMVVVGGAADAGNAIGDKVQMGPTADWAEGLIDGLLNQHNDDGTHKDITANSATVTGAVSAGSLTTSGVLAGNTATVTGKASVGQLQVTAANTASSDGSGNITPSAQIYTVTALAAAAAIQLPSFTPWHGAAVILQLFGAGAQTLTHAAAYENVSGLDLPTTTVAGKWLTYGLIYNSFANAGAGKWQILSIAQEA